MGTLGIRRGVLVGGLKVVVRPISRVAETAGS